MNEPGNILCIHLNQVGDLLFSLPALQALRKRFPSAHIASVVRPNCADLLRRSSTADEAIPRERSGLASDMRLAVQLRRRKFDLIVLFSTSTATWLMAQIVGAPVKAGFTDSMNGLLLDIVSPWSPPPCTANNLLLVERIGCETAKKGYEGLVSPSEVDLHAAEALLGEVGISGEERFVVIAPGTSTGRETKAWSDDGYAEVADRVAEEYRMRSVVVGTGYKSRICGLSRSAVDLSGRTSLTVLAGLCAKASLFIGVDSGAMHLAGAVGTPVVALFGPTNPDVTGPQGSRSVVVSKSVQCSPCYGHSCQSPVCMEKISVSDIMRAAASLVVDR